MIASRKFSGSVLRIKHLFIIGTCFFVFAIIVYGDTINDSQIKQAILLVKDRNVFSLPLSEKSVWKTDETGSIDLPDESPFHFQGVYGSRENQLSIYSKPLESLRAGLYSAPYVRVLAPPITEISKAEAASVASKYLAKYFTWFALDTADVFVVPQRSDGVFRFTFTDRNAENFPLATAFVGVRSFDGKIVQVSCTRVKDPIPKHIIGIIKGKQVIVDLVKKQRLYKEAIISDGHVNGDAIHGTYYVYDIIARDSETGSYVISAPGLNPLTGELLTQSLQWTLLDEDWRAMRQPVSDVMPSWNNLGLLFQANRDLRGLPFWSHYENQIFIFDVESVKSLTSDSERQPEFAGSSIESGIATLVRNNWTYAFNLKTGTYRVLASPGRDGATPITDNAGHWAITSGSSGESRATVDLFPDDITRTKIMDGIRGRLVLPGDQHHPMFSPDDKWLYFITTTWNKADKKGEMPTAIHTLQRMAASEAHTTDLKTVDIAKVETIAVLPDAIQRLSIFPDGSKLLAQTAKGIQVVSVADKKVTSLKFAAQTDAEVGAAVTNPIDGWAGPTDDRVTFSGQTKDKAGAVRRRIYSCRFDGTDLKAHTPKDNTPVEQYVFPETKKTAYDLAKEWALGEIAYDDKRRERSN